MVFSKAYWEKYRAQKAAGVAVKLAGKKRGQKGYPLEVKNGDVTKEKYNTKEAEGKLYLLGNPSARMLKKAVLAGLNEQQLPDSYIDGLVAKIAGAGVFDSKELVKINKLLHKANEKLDVQELAVKASQYVLDKQVPDKIAPQKSGGTENVDELRASVLRLFKGLKGASKLSVGISVETDGSGNEGNPGNGGRQIHTRIESITKGPSGLERPPSNRLLRTGGDTPGKLPQIEKDPPSPTGLEQLGKDLNGGSGSDLVRNREASI